MSQVAFHPRAAVLVLGYEDGLILMVRLKDNSEILIRKEQPDGGAVSALAWNGLGTQLLFGTRNGMPPVCCRFPHDGVGSAGTDSRGPIAGR